MFNRTFSARVDLLASPDFVWAVLVDVDGYPAWNPYTVFLDSSLALGDPVRVELQATPRRLRVLDFSVSSNRLYRELCWVRTWGGPRLLRHEFCQRLQRLPDGYTRYTVSETFTGWLVPLRMLGQAEHIQRGLNGICVALKTAAETRKRPWEYMDVRRS